MSENSGLVPMEGQAHSDKTSENSSISTSQYSTGDLIDAFTNGDLTANHIDTLTNGHSIAARPLTNGHSTADYNHLLINRWTKGDYADTIYYPDNPDNGVMPIAVIGMGCRFPGGSSSSEKLWDMLANGRSGCSKIHADRFTQGSFEHPSSDDGGTVGSDFSMSLMLMADITISG